MSRRGVKPDRYAKSGVDELREQLAFRSVMLPWLQDTDIASDDVKLLHGVDTGHFATVLELGENLAIALSTDGVGTKILIARMAQRYDTVGVDCVANNVNDLICIGADPVVLLDYLAIDQVDEAVLEDLARGLYRGSKVAGIAIPGGEIAQVRDLLASKPESGPMFDLVGTAVGILKGRKPLDGSAVASGDVVIGLPSSGLHSNGYSLVRRVLEEAQLDLSMTVPGTDQNLADALLEPTTVYVPAIRALWHQDVPLHGVVNISGGGLLNLTRLRSGSRTCLISFQLHRRSSS